MTAPVRSLLLLTIAFWIPRSAPAQQTIHVPPPHVGGDDTAEILNAMGQLTDGDTLQFSSGTYDVALSGYPNGIALTFSSISDLTVAGDPGGTTLAFHGFDPTVHGDNLTLWYAGLVFQNCDRVTVEDLDVEVVRPLATEGEIVSVHFPAADQAVVHVRTTDPQMVIAPGTWTLLQLSPVYNAAHANAGQLVERALIGSATSATAKLNAAPPAGSQQDILINFTGLATWEVARFTHMDSIKSDLTAVIMHQKRSFPCTGGLFQDCEDVTVVRSAFRSFVKGTSLERC